MTSTPQDAAALLDDPATLVVPTDYADALALAGAIADTYLAREASSEGMNSALTVIGDICIQHPTRAITDIGGKIAQHRATNTAPSEEVIALLTPTLVSLGVIGDAPPPPVEKFIDDRPEHFTVPEDEADAETAAADLLIGYLNGDLTAARWENTGRLLDRIIRTHPTKRIVTKIGPAWIRQRPAGAQEAFAFLDGLRADA